MAEKITSRLGEFVSALTYADIPPEAIGLIKNGFADCIGVMIAGAQEPASQLVKSTLLPNGQESTLLFGNERASALDAALINGTAAHALDFDDVTQRGEHPSAVLVPAIIAEAEAIGADGKQMLTAYAAGYEVWAELSRRESDYHHNKGWHPTGVFGAIGAAAACASLRKASPQQAAMAIALGASQSGGLMSNFGTMTKPFHVGRAAQSGVLSARLATAGFSASMDALEHPPGFLMAVSPAGRIDLDSLVEAGKVWRLLTNRLSIKKYPLCFCTHRALDGVLDILKTNPVNGDEVKKVTVSTSRRGTVILRNHEPKTGLEAKFSMEFAIASALVARRAGLAELADKFVNSSDVQSTMKRVDIIPDDRDDPHHPGYAIYDQVIIEKSDGRRLDSGEISHVRGGPEAPLSAEELWAKFEDCVKSGSKSLSPHRIFESVMKLENLRHAGDLSGLQTRH